MPSAAVVVETPERTQHVGKVPPVVGRQIAGLVQHEARVIGRHAQRKELDADPGERAGIGAAVAKAKCRIGHKRYANGYRRQGDAVHTLMVSDTVGVCQLPACGWRFNRFERSRQMGMFDTVGTAPAKSTARKTRCGSSNA